MSHPFPAPEILKKTRLLVIGDLMVDRYLSGQIRRISPEAPVPVLKFEKESCLLGGAANVVHNLVALGSSPIVAGVIGQDSYGSLIKGKIEKLGLSSEGLFADPERTTIIKTRVTSGNQQVLRIDRESDRPIEANVLNRVQDFILKTLKECQAVLFSDYNKGLLTPQLLSRTIEEARRLKIPVFVDPKGHAFDKYRGASFITPNRAEAQEVARGINLENLQNLRDVVLDWIDRLDLEGMLVTLGKEGLLVAIGRGSNFESQFIEAEQREVYDVTGAGDTVIATFSLLVSAGLNPLEAAEWANRAAGVVVGKIGAATVTASELIGYSERFEPWQRKVKTVEELRLSLMEARKRGLRIVFSNGCFDLLHVGHIQILQAARQKGDLLVVGINSDESVRQLKGEGRPLIPEKERLQILASLDFVDYLVVYPETTPNTLIKELKPDILVKGANYSPEEVTGHEIVESYGGRVELVPIRNQVSVSGLVDHILQRFGKD